MPNVTISISHSEFDVTGYLEHHWIGEIHLAQALQLLQDHCVWQLNYDREVSSEIAVIVKPTYHMVHPIPKGNLPKTSQVLEVQKAHQNIDPKSLLREVAQCFEPFFLIGNLL